MPITVIATEGLIPVALEEQLFADLSALFIRQHNLAGNTFLTPNVIGEIKLISPQHSFAGGRRAPIVIVELKVPSFALSTPDQKKAFVAEATDLVHRAAGARLPKENIYVNMVYSVDGLWGIAGRAYTDNALLDAVARAAA